MLAGQALNCLLFLFLCLVFLSTIAQIAELNEMRPATILVLATALFFAHPDFLWGEFAGLEGPLTALLLAVFARSCLFRPSPIPLATIAALTVATRPELFPVCALSPLVAVFMRRWWGAAREPRPAGGAGRELVIAYAVFGGIVTALYLPLRLTAGSWLPASMGARIELNVTYDPREFVSRMWSLRRQHWVVVSAALVFANFCSWSHTTTRRFLSLGLFLCLCFGIRALFGLSDFSIHDRYVSYFWPLIVITMVGIAAPTLRSASHWLIADRPAPIRRAVILAGFLAMGAVWCAALIQATTDLGADIQAMMEVVVGPSQWMQANLPKASQVAMEPAGAIRLFTDHYLVDETGLTTQHLKHPFRTTREYLQFLDDNHVQYVFDYEHRLPFLAQPSFERVISWKLTHPGSWGNICLFRYAAGRQPLS